MTDDNKPDISVGNAQGGMINIGGQQTVHGNVTITIRDMTQIIDSSPGADAATKTELQVLLRQLADELKSVDAKHQLEAEKVAKRAETLIEEVTAEEPDPNMVEASKTALQRAAEAIESAMPAVTRIATQIILAAAKFYAM